jgi:hypothetical protein
VAYSWDPHNIFLQTITRMICIRCAPPSLNFDVLLDVSQYDSLPRSPTSNSNLPHMTLALPSYMHVSSRRLTPSIRNVTHMPKRFLVSAANLSRFSPSCVSQGPKGPLWRLKETVYAKPCCISSRKARHHIRNKASRGLLNVLQSRSVTIIAFGHTAVSRPQAWLVCLWPSVWSLPFAHTWFILSRPTKVASSTRTNTIDMDCVRPCIFSCANHCLARGV